MNLKSMVLVFALVLLISTKSLAVPAAPIVHELKNADGSVFKARLMGDEWVSWIETLDGYTIVFNESSGNWEYAVLKDSKLEPSGVVVGKDYPLESSKGLRPEINRSKLKILSFFRGRAVKAPVTGVFKFPVILIDFPDEPARFTVADFENLLFNEDNPNSVDSYYKEVSYGKLDLEGVVMGWFRANNYSCYYGYQNGWQRAAELVKEAVQKADPYIDFSQFDNDGDGYVDVVAIIYAGEGYEVSLNGCDIWSHTGDLKNVGGYTTDDGVQIGTYTIQHETLEGDITTIGVFCHELAHAFGLPDLYDLDGTSDGVGAWDLVGISGSWNQINRIGDSPAHPSAWCKWYLGWLTPTIVTGRITATIPNVEQNPVAYQLIYNPNGPWDWNKDSGGVGEYFLVENRYKIGFDAALPGEGLLIWHIDESMVSNTDENHKLVDLEEADGRNDLDYADNNNVGDDTDPWYSNYIGFRENSIPNSNFYNGTPSFVRVYNISEAGLTMTATMEIAKYVVIGTIFYTGEQSGTIYVFAYDYNNGLLVTHTTLSQLGTYLLNLANGRYIIAAFMDLNGNGYYDMGEPAGYAINKSLGEQPDEIVVNGYNVIGADITLKRYISSCAVIDSPGYYILTQDIIDSSAEICINITSNDVVFDGNGHTIDGVGSGWGIYAKSVTNVTVKNTNVTDWNLGIYYNDVQNGRIEDNNLYSNNEGVWLDYSTNNTIIDNTVTNSDGCIWLWYSYGNMISNNNVTNSNVGIVLFFSDRNIIKNNNAMYNDYGISLQYSNINIIYLNNFIDNADNLYSANSSNVWNTLQPMIYEYNGQTYTNYLGNYWSDYTGSDLDRDGVGDTPYSVDGENDYYPLMDRVENFVILTPVNSCAVIDSPGYYILTQDIIDSSAEICINITSNDVVFDGNGHTIDGVGSGWGIYAKSVTNVTVKNTNVTDWNLGIYYNDVQNGRIEDNNLYSNNEGILLYNSSSNTITSNNLANKWGGIILDHSSSNTIGSNNFENDGLIIFYSYQNTVENNIVNQKPLVYLENVQNVKISDAGQVILVNCENISVERLNISNTDFGIELWRTNESRIENNIITNNIEGIFLAYSKSNIIMSNNISSNYDGISSGYSSNNTIINNILSNNSYGVSLYRSTSNIIESNAILGNGDGIHIAYSSSNTITNNTILNNDYGIKISYLYYTSSQVLANDLASGSYIWIGYWKSCESQFVSDTTNEVGSRACFSFWDESLRTLNTAISSYTGNLIYNNYFNNTNNFEFYGELLQNTWNITKTLSKNVIGGPYLGGNFWAKPDGTGFSQTCEDNNKDGICDNAYQLNANNTDYLPLTFYTTKMGDIDNDGDVDFNDLIGTLNLILTGGYSAAADIDGNGDIDFNDLIGVLNIILAS